MPTTNGANSLHVRDARESDLPEIRAIYNQGIEDRIATLDEDPKSESFMQDWYGERYAVVVAERAQRIVGWASLNPYSHRCAYRGVADLSVYVERTARGGGVGTTLLEKVEEAGRRGGFTKSSSSRWHKTKRANASIVRWGTARSARSRNKAGSMDDMSTSSLWRKS